EDGRGRAQRGQSARERARPGGDGRIGRPHALDVRIELGVATEVLRARQVARPGRQDEAEAVAPAPHALEGQARRDRGRGRGAREAIVEEEVDGEAAERGAADERGDAGGLGVVEALAWRVSGAVGAVAVEGEERDAAGDERRGAAGRRPL